MAYRRTTGQVEIKFDATECKITVSDGDEAETASLTLADLDAIINTLTQVRREADPALWQIAATPAPAPSP